MTPEEIVAEINDLNRDVLYARTDFQNLTHQQVLALMDSAAMRGFQLGSNVALSMVQGALVIQLSKIVATNAKTQGLVDVKHLRE